MCIKIWNPRPSVCNGNGKLEILLAKFLVLDKKQIKYSQLLRKQPKENTMKKFKTKAIQADEGIFTHILAYPNVFKHKQSVAIVITLCNPGIFRTLAYTEQKAYSQSWYIENRGIFRALVYSEAWHIQNLAHSKPCQTSTIERFRKNSQGL